MAIVDAPTKMKLRNGFKEYFQFSKEIYLNA
jgi:hypothetical protein